MHQPPNDAPDAPDDAPRTDWKRLRMEYISGQWTNRELAARHGCSHTQIGRRATKEGWKRLTDGGAREDAPQPLVHAPPPAADAPPANEVPPVSRVLLKRAAAEDPTLATTTPTEEAFITEYLRNGMNATAAAVAVLGESVAVAKATAWQMLRRPRVAARISAERQRLATAHQMDRDQLLQEFLAIVRADPNELMQMRAVACGDCWPKDNTARGNWTEPDPECPACGGEGQPMPWFADTRKLSPEARALFAGVKVTKDGATILTHDKMAALQNIGRILGAFEKDNAQKQAPLSEAIAQFVGQLHSEGAGRLKYSPPPQPLHAQKKVQH